MEFSGPIRGGGVVNRVFRPDFESINSRGVVDGVFPPDMEFSRPIYYFKIDVKIREICLCCRETVRRHSNP